MSRFLNFLMLQKQAENRGVDKAAATRIGAFGFATPSPMYALVLGTVLIDRELESQAPPAPPPSTGGGTTGKEPVAVPEVVRLQLPLAEKKLKDFGLGSSTSQKVTSDRPDNEVIAQNPAAESVRPLGTVVDLTVSTGPPERGPEVTSALDTQIVALARQIVAAADQPNSPPSSRR